MNGQSQIDLAHIHWSSPEWIYALPTHTLASADEALDYFALSPFWDPLSNNSNLRTQHVVQGVPYGSAQEKFDLPKFRSGFEYVISHAQPPELFGIQRREVESSGSRDEVTAQWFILEGKIYPTPTLLDVIQTKLRNASFLLSNTFSELAAAKPASNPRSHPLWRALPPSQPSQLDSPAGDETAAQPSAKPKPQQPNFRLLNALQTTHASLTELEEMAARPPETIDGYAELEAIEREIYGSNSKTVSIAPSRAEGRSVMGVGTNAGTAAGSPATALKVGGMRMGTPAWSAASPMTGQ